MVQLVFSEVDIKRTQSPLWSVFEKNTKGKYIKIADFDTFISMNGKHESQIVQNAVEQGQFRSVNKIRKPNTCTIELAKGGDSQDIQLVLDSLKKYKESTALLVVYTPFGNLENMNLINLDYSFRKGDNASMLVAKLTLQEVQSVGQVLQYTSVTVQAPENENTQNVGEKSPKAEGK